MQVLDSYIRWYNETRIKLSLGSLSPIEYRESLGIAAYLSPRNRPHPPPSMAGQFSAGANRLTFPFDSESHVPLDTLSERALSNYLFARAAVPRDALTPASR